MNPEELKRLLDETDSGHPECDQRIRWASQAILALVEENARLREALDGMVRRHKTSLQNWTQAVMDAQKSGDYELVCSLRNTALQALDGFPIDAASQALGEPK